MFVNAVFVCYNSLVCSIKKRECVRMVPSFFFSIFPFIFTLHVIFQLPLVDHVVFSFLYMYVNTLHFLRNYRRFYVLNFYKIYNHHPVWISF